MSQTTNVTQIDILGSIERFAGDTVLTVLKFAALFVALTIIPVVFTALPLWAYLRNNYDELSTAVHIAYWLVPFSCGFYMFLAANWTTVRNYQRMYGTTKGWRKGHGGIIGTTLKGFLFLFVGLVGSFACEILYFKAAVYVVPDTPTSEWAFVYTFLPTAGLVPFILLCVWRWFRNGELRRSLTPQSPTLAEQIAKAVGAGRVGEMDHKEIVRIAQRGSVEAALVGQALEDHLRDLAAGYREAARQMAEEEKLAKSEAAMNRKREADLLSRIDAQIARMKERRG